VTGRDTAAPQVAVKRVLEQEQAIAADHISKVVRYL